MSVIGHSPLAGASGAAGGGDPVYVDEVFSIDLYRNDSNTEEFNNGLDMAGEGGLIVTTFRDLGTDWGWVDSERGVTKAIFSNQTIQEQTQAWIQSFDNDGFTHGSYIGTGNTSAVVSWSFRKAPGFFDVVTYTGNGNVRTISHNLGSVPGMILIKMTSDSDSWVVYHRSTGATHYLTLNNSGAAVDNDSRFNDTEPTASVFTVGTDNGVNQNGNTFVAYLFAHDDQSFGTDNDESIIKCGSWNSSGGAATINLGFEPQLVMTKCSSGTGAWLVFDSMRGMTVGGNDAYLIPSSASPEDSSTNFIDLTSNGFTVSNMGSSQTFIYMAIRRPHKPPTAGTDVFKMQATSSNDVSLTSLNPYSDLVLTRKLVSSNTVYNSAFVDRLRGNKQILTSSQARAETNFSGTNPDVELVGLEYPFQRIDSESMVFHSFKRAPGFFDMVAYTGTGSTRTITHNLNSAPKMMIFKIRSTSNSWIVYHESAGATHYLMLDQTSAAAAHSSPFNNTDPTSSVFTLGPSSGANGNNQTFIAYLFASLDGISKVSSYTGTGSNINVNCGFTAGARFVLIKRTDSSGDWYVWDTTRGIVSGNDPYLLLNSTAVQVTNTDYLDPLNAGFTVTSNAPAALNTSGGTYLFLAIA